MLVDVRLGHVVHLLDDLVDRAVGDDHHSGGVVGDGEVSQQLPDELDLIVEVLCSHRGAGVDEEHEISLDS